MQVILTQTIHNVGKIGDCVDVKRGYARHFLFPKGLALPATKENLQTLEKRRAELEKAAAERRAEAVTRAEAINQLDAVVIKARVASEDKLYGSVGVSEITQAAEATGCSIASSEVCLPEGVIRTLGDYAIKIQLDADVTATLDIKVVAQED